MKKTKFLFVISFAALLMGCGPSDKEVETLTAQAYEQGKNAGFNNGYHQGHEEGVAKGFEKGKVEGEALGAKVATDQARSEGYTQGHTDGIEYGITEGRKIQFIETSVLGIKNIYPESVVFGFSVFFFCFTFSVLWKMFSPRLSTYIAEKLQLLSWAMIAKLGKKRKLQVLKGRWDNEYNHIVLKSDVAEQHIEQEQSKIARYKEFMPNIPEEQKPYVQKKIASSIGHIKQLRNVILQGISHKEDIDRINQGIDLLIFEIDEGHEVDIEDLLLGFTDIQQDIKTYLRYDVGHLSEYDSGVFEPFSA